MTTATLVYPDPITLARVSMLINSKGIDPIIAELDLEMVKMKLRDPEEGKGWSIEDCDYAEVEYKRFLHLNLKHRRKGIVPDKIIDTIWHYHILDTRAYHRDSEKVFGGYFHHFPYFGMRGDQDAKDLENAVGETKGLYEKEFGEPMFRGMDGSCQTNCTCTAECSS